MENVLLRADDFGPIIYGDTNITGTEIFFDGNGENLIEPAGGQARIEAFDGDIDHLTFGASDPTLGMLKVQFNIDAAADANLSVVGTDQFGGTFAYNFLGDASGQNFLTAYTINDQWIDTIDIYSNNPGDEIYGISDLQQVRVGPDPFPADPDPVDVSTPGSAGLLAMGLAALVTCRRQASKRLAV